MVERNAEGQTALHARRDSSNRLPRPLKGRFHAQECHPRDRTGRYTDPLPASPHILKTTPLSALPSNPTPTPKLPLQYGPNSQSLFDQFAHSARIPTTPAAFRPPRHRSSYRDDIRLEHYIKPALKYAGFQRRGIHDNSEHLSSIEQHVIQALAEDFPLSIDAPLAEHTKKASIFGRDSPRARWALFGHHKSSAYPHWRPAPAHYRTVGQLHSDSPYTGSRKAQHRRFAQLMDHCGLSGQTWLDQFAFGFPIAGVLSLRNTPSNRLNRTTIF